MLTAPAMPRQLYQNVGMCLDAVIAMPSEGWHVGWRNLGAARWKGSRLLDLSPSPRTYEGHCSPPDSPLLERSLNGDKLWQIVRDYGGRKKIHTFKGTFFITFCTSLSTNRLVNHAYYVGIIFIFTQTSGLLFNPEYSLLFPVGFYTVSSEERSPPPRWHCGTASCQRVLFALCCLSWNFWLCRHEVGRLGVLPGLLLRSSIP